MRNSAIADYVEYGMSICLYVLCIYGPKAAEQGNGLRRINDILEWEDVSICAGDQRTKLSFQRGYVPLLQVRLTHTTTDDALT